MDATTVHVEYSEPVAGAELPGSYLVDPHLAVTGVAVQGDTHVLTTAAQAEGQAYGLAAVGVADRAGNPVANEGSFGVVTSFSFPYAAGWSLVGVPLSSSQTVAEIVGSGRRESFKVGPVWTWGDGGMRRHPDGEAFVAEHGYWMFARAPGQSRPVVGLRADGVIPLAMGWNLISPVVDTPLPWERGIRGPAWGWDPALRSYTAVHPGGLLEAGHAYWVRVDTEGVVLRTGQ